MGSVGETPALSIADLSKTFSGTQVLKKVSFDVYPGEIHGLIGANGSGKSTIIKILSGYHTADAGGHVLLDGKPLDVTGAGQQARTAIGFVHQDLGLIDDLNGLDNLFLTPTGTVRWRLRVDKRQEMRLAEALRDQFYLDLDLTKPVNQLTSPQRASLAILRALHQMDESSVAHPVLVFDEPTAHLPGRETEQLFQVIRGVAERGVAILFVSHRLQELLNLTHRLTVLRDGEVVARLQTDQVDVSALTEAILGRELVEFESASTHLQKMGECVLSARGLTGSELTDLSFDLRRGELLGVAGVIGAGQDELPYLLFGAERAARGEVLLDGVNVTGDSPRRMVKRGVALIPADRHGLSGIQDATVRENVMMSSGDMFFIRGVFRHRAEIKHVAALLEEFDVRPRRTEEQFALLSGGNQQKALLSKWLQRNPKVLLLHEVTQGVDVGARAHIHGIIKGLLEDGTAMLLCSSDFEELAAMCDRVMVLSDGHLVRELAGDELTEDAIGHYVQIGAGTNVSPGQPVLSDASATT